VANLVLEQEREPQKIRDRDNAIGNRCCSVFNLWCRRQQKISCRMCQLRSRGQATRSSEHRRQQKIVCHRCQHGSRRQATHISEHRGRGTWRRWLVDSKPGHVRGQGTWRRCLVNSSWLMRRGQGTCRRLVRRGCAPHGSRGGSCRTTSCC
jgi:hypothetical protein